MRITKAAIRRGLKQLSKNWPPNGDMINMPPLGSPRNPVWLPRSLYNRAKAMGIDMTGYAIQRMIPRRKK